MKRRPRSKWALTLVAVILLPIFLALGYWQLQRAEQKHELQIEYDTRASDASVRIPSHVQQAEDLRFYRVVADGTYDADYQLLLDNRVHHGVAGFFVITPLRISDSDVRVMVNRGWLAWGESRESSPEIEVPQGSQKITGVATVPTERVFTLGELGPVQKSQPTLWPYLDLERYRKTVPFPVQPIIILLDPASDAGGFTREWNRLEAGIAVHQGYAFQWFALAAGMLVIYILLSRRANVNRRDVGNEQNSDK